MLKQNGIKVLINNSDFGYILRRLDSYSYEIWNDTKQKVDILNKSEFKEIQPKSGDILYELRNKRQ